MTQAQRDAIDRWMRRFYRPERFHNEPGWNADREQRLIADREADIQRQGFALISHHDSVTGKAEYLGMIPGYVIDNSSVGITLFEAEGA